MLRAFFSSPALRVAAAFGTGGAAFALGNLILARVLSAQDYGTLSLVMAIIGVATIAAPLGMDLVIARRGMGFDAPMRRATLGASVLTALGAAAIGSLLYGLPLSLSACILAATLTGGVTQAAAAYFQGKSQFSIAVPLLQASNWALLPIAALTAYLAIDNATTPALMISVAALVTAFFAHALALREHAGQDAETRPSALWGEALSLVTINTASSVFLMLERLVIPFALDIEELARFGVLAALVGSPFRMIQAAVSFTVLPRLRAAQTGAARRYLLQREALMVASVSLGLSIVSWPIVPRLAHWLFDGRYDLSPALMLATLVAGSLKVLSAFVTATATALAPERGLRALSLGSWVCIAIAVPAALAAAPWGLTGVTYGVCVGWAARCLIALWICLPYLRGSADLQAAADPSCTGLSHPGERKSHRNRAAAR